MELKQLESIMDSGSGIPEPKAMDDILKFLISESLKEDRYLGNYEIKEAIFPDIDKDIVDLLLKKIISAGDHIVDAKVREDRIPGFTAFFKATILTAKYLEQGGFYGKYSQILEDKRLEKTRNETEVMVLEDSLKTNRSTRRNYRINTAISIAALLVSLLAIAISLRLL